ncbi:double zinc ribbon domain-containing protein [Halobaculum litoreum]|uniref:Zinc ribbon domain-containing protein n=1 Tax=Halobaculum litoreum TaxID=3031998 RepID=A0ABD5XMH4_9EURY|nr:zinc ribbon domain-containing protein [Halobaculum sp. DT92]
MSKITFRADADLVDRLEGLEGSKSEVMREALRSHLDEAERADATGPDAAAGASGGGDDSLDDALAARVDELVTARLDAEFGERPAARATPRPFGVPSDTPPVNLTVNVDGAGVDATASDPDADRSSEPAVGASEDTAPDADAEAAAGSACGRCGESVSDDHVYCPNCGEKASRRAFCECGDEVRSDWAFCPGCGRRTAAADVLDRQ